MMWKHQLFLSIATCCLAWFHTCYGNAIDVTRFEAAARAEENSQGEPAARDFEIYELRNLLRTLPTGYQRPRPVQLPPVGEAVHICIAAGYKRVIEEVSMLLKSLFLLVETREVFLHLLVNDDSRSDIASFLTAHDRAFVPFRYEMKTLDEVWLTGILERSGVRYTHHSGIFGMSKVFFYLIWENVDRCLIIDTDVVFGTDPAYLWSQFAAMTPSSLVMMQLSGTAPQLESCSGVMLQNFEQMRQKSFFDYVKPLVPKYCKADDVSHSESQYSSGPSFDCKSDQHLYHSVHKEHGDLFTEMDLSWNLEMCHRFHDVDFEHHLGKSENYFFGIAHFNCVYNDTEHDAFRSFVEDYGSRYVNLASYINKITSLNKKSFDAAKHFVRRVGECLV